MKQLYRLSFVLIFLSGVWGGGVSAQKDTTRLNQEVEVVKAYRPAIANANKVNLLPVIVDTTRFTPEFNYTISSHPVTSGFSATPMGAADVNGQPESDYGLGFLKLGVGTISNAYGELFLQLPKSGVATLGLHLRHLSSDGKLKLRDGDLVDAPYSQNGAEIFGALNIGNTILYSNLSYQRDAIYYYGYPVDLPADLDSYPGMEYGTKQVYQNGDIRVAFKSNDAIEGPLRFDAGFRGGYYDAKTNQKERYGGFFGNFNYDFDTFNGLLKLSYDHFSTDSVQLESSVGNLSQGWMRVAPSVRFSGDNWDARGGINFVAVSDKEGGNITRMYPDFEVNFKPIEDYLTLYATFGGDLKNNDLRTVTNENPWVDPRQIMTSTDYQYLFAAGVKGKITREVGYHLELNRSQVKNYSFYSMNRLDDAIMSLLPIPAHYDNAFDFIYDNVGITNFSAELSYVSGNDLSVVLKGNYYHYNLDTLDFAPQKADYDFSASVGFRVLERLTGFTDLQLLGDRKALVRNLDHSPVVFSMDPIVVLNIGANYDLTGKMKVFGRVDNLLNKKNEQWLGYTSQGVRLLAGITYSF